MRFGGLDEGRGSLLDEVVVALLLGQRAGASIQSASADSVREALADGTPVPDAAEGRAPDGSTGAPRRATGR